MASRGFYLLSSALLSGSALLVWLAVGREPEGDAEAPASASGREGDDGRALGVAAADYDPVRAPVSADASLVRAAASPAAPRAVSLPRGPAPAPFVQSPVAGSPALNTQAEASAAARPKVVEAIRAQLERRRSDLRKSCWPAGSDVAATFSVAASFTAEGSMVSLGVSDVPGMPGVGTCLMGQLAQNPLALPEAPGVAVAVDVPIAFTGSQTLPPPARPTSLGRR